MGRFREYFRPEALLNIGQVVAGNYTFIIRTLSQAGFEFYPTNPTLRFDYYFFYPNPAKVMMYILREHGILAVFTSVVERIVKETATNALGMFFAVELMKIRGPKEAAPADKEKGSVVKTWVPVYLQHCLKLGLAKVMATVVCHPLHVLAVRKVMDLFNGGAIYSNPLNAVKHIYLSEGIPGFFSGLAPSLTRAVGSFALMALLERYSKLNTRWAVGGVKLQPWSLCVAYLTYPLSTVATVMIAGSTALPYSSSLYPTSLHCFADLLRKGRIFRGCYML